VVTTSTRRFRGAPRLVLNIEDTTSMALDNDHFRTRLSFAQWPSRPARRAVDQGDEYVVEHHPVEDPSAVTTPEMARDELGTTCVIELRGELDPQRFDQRC